MSYDYRLVLLSVILVSEPAGLAQEVSRSAIRNFSHREAYFSKELSRFCNLELDSIFICMVRQALMYRYSRQMADCFGRIYGSL